MSEFLKDTFIGSMPLDSADRLFRSPSGLFFECRGIARAVPVKIDKIEVCLNIHIYPIIDFDLLIGYPLENFHHSPLGSLHEKLGEKTSAHLAKRTLLRSLAPNKTRLRRCMSKSHHPRSSLSLFFLAHMVLFSITIGIQPRSSTMNLLRYKTLGLGNPVRH